MGNLLCKFKAFALYPSCVRQDGYIKSFTIVVKKKQKTLYLHIQTQTNRFRLSMAWENQHFISTIKGSK